MKDSARETVNPRPCLSGNQRGFLSSAVTITLLLAIISSAYVAVSAAKFSLVPGSYLKALSTVLPPLMSAADSLSVHGTRRMTFVSAMRRAAFQSGSRRRTRAGGEERARTKEEIKECDLEGAAKIGDLIFWIGSHGRNKDADEKKEREVFFATKLTGVGKDAKLEIAGKVYTKLLDDLKNDPALAQFDLSKAATLAPKEQGALNIESLAADGGKLWIGFRNPMETKRRGVDGSTTQPQGGHRERWQGRELGEPVTLNLGELGFRDIVRLHDSLPDDCRGFR